MTTLSMKCQPIEFVANENGYGDRLPKKGRKYIGSQGDRRWTLPLEHLDQVRKIADLVFDSDGHKI